MNLMFDIGRLLFKFVPCTFTIKGKPFCMQDNTCKVIEKWLGGKGKKNHEIYLQFAWSVCCIRVKHS